MPKALLPLPYGGGLGHTDSFTFTGKVIFIL